MADLVQLAEYLRMLQGHRWLARISVLHILAAYTILSILPKAYSTTLGFVQVACQVEMFAQSSICHFIQPPSAARWAKVPDALDREFDGLEHLLVGSSQALVMGHRLTVARLSVDDLITLVKSGDLGCRDALLEQLIGFNAKSKEVSRQLHLFVASVSASVDRTVFSSANVIGMLSKTHAPLSPMWMLCGSVGHVIDLPNCLADPGKTAAAFEQVVTHLDYSLSTLISSTEDLQRNLDILEKQLSLIRDIVSHNLNVVSTELETELDNVLARLWAALGGKRKRLAKFRSNIESLKKVVSYRRAAYHYIVSTQRGLEAMGEDLEILRSAASGYLLVDHNVPLKKVMESLSAGAERLRARLDGGPGEARQIAASEVKLR